MRRGWFRDSVRHSLAARGIKTNYSYMRLKRAKPQLIKQYEGDPLAGVRSPKELVERKFRAEAMRKKARELASIARENKKNAETEEEREKYEAQRAIFSAISRALKAELREEINPRIYKLQNPPRRLVNGEWKQAGPQLGKEAAEMLDERERANRIARNKAAIEAQERVKKLELVEEDFLGTPEYAEPVREILTQYGRRTGYPDTRKEEKVQEESLKKMLNIREEGKTAPELKRRSMIISGYGGVTKKGGEKRKAVQEEFEQERREGMKEFLGLKDEDVKPVKAKLSVQERKELDEVRNEIIEGLNKGLRPGKAKELTELQKLNFERSRVGRNELSQEQAMRMIVDEQRKKAGLPKLRDST